MMIRVVAAVIACVILIGAVICVRDCVQFYRECRTDGIYKLPLSMAIVLTLIAVIVVLVYCA
jgi:hypothetical protein